MKTYDIYAKQNGNWQRKGIQGEPTLPEYDGTVIIEKAESVLGLRRFKNIIEKPSFTEANVEYTMTFDGDTANCTQIKVGLFNENEVLIYVNDITPIYVYSFTQALWGNEQYKTINIISCEDETAKAWLLANTEGVSV